MKKLLLNNLEMMKYVAKFCPKQIPIIIFMSILQSIQSIIGVILLKYVIDAIRSFKSFYDLLIIIFSLLVLNIVISVIQIWIEQKVVPVNSQIIIGKMQMLIFEKAVALDLDCYENTVYYNKLLTAREQAETRILGVLNSFSTLISSLLGISAFIAIIATVEPIIIIVSVLNVTLSFLFNAIAIKNQNIFYQKKIPIEREMNYIQRVSAQAEFAKEIRIYNKFPNLLKKRFEKRLQEIIDLTNCFANKYVKIISFQNGINQFFNSGVIIYLSYRTLSSLISVGDFIALANSSQQLTSQLTLLIKVFPELYEHAIYLENFFEFMNYQPKIKDGEDVIDDLKNVDIEFKNVSFGYPNNDKQILKNINLTINHGEKVAIVGRNGAGKSTLVKLLNRLYDPTSGSIYIQGKDYRNYSTQSIRKYIGTLFQDFQIFAVSVAENIKMSRVEYSNEQQNDVMTALEFVNLKNKIQTLKNGINSEVTREFDNEGVIFSGGEYQKIAIARVFSKKSGIMIFDEPSSALDPISEKEIFDKMLELSNGKTVIFISHRLSNITNVDKIIYLEEGTIKEVGTHSELMIKNGLYAKMYRLQADKYLFDLGKR